ncbi:FG-GAP repeat-containing protein [Raphanus sativus]|nr:FG-GAP repeat-containing protein [Raphanus sativus]
MARRRRRFSLLQMSAKIQNHMGPIEELGMTERNAEQHRRSATENQKPEEYIRWKKDLSRKIPKLIRKAARYAGSAKPNKFHLLEGGIHADINGDGVLLDHVQGTVVIGSMEVLKPCWAVATTGVPVGEQLFNVSTCHHAAFNFLHYGEHSQNFTDTRLMCTATASRSGNGSFRRKQHGRISRLHWV